MKAVRRLICLLLSAPACVLFAGMLLHLSRADAQQADKEKAAQMIKSAAVLLDEGDTERSLAAVREAVVVSPGDADAYDLMGTILLKKGQFDEALSAFSQALKANPNLRHAKTGTGLALLGKGDFAKAEEALTNALLLNPYPAMTHYALGLLYQKMNDDKKSLFHFKEGLRTFKEGKK